MNKQPAEPVAWRVTLALGMGYSYVERDLTPNYKCEPLYLIPDPRLAALTELLRECLTSIDRVNDWELQERIEAALGKEG